MLTTRTDPKGRVTFRDEASALTSNEKKLVLAAMAGGLTSFSIPTPADDHNRTDWLVRTWLTLRDGKPVAFLVAYQPLHPEFEVVGPDIQMPNVTLDAGDGTNGKLQKR